MLGRRDRHQEKKGHRRRKLDFERLEKREMLSAAGVLEPLASTVETTLSTANVAPIDTPITSLTYRAFELLTPAQIPLLLPSQVATIPDYYWLQRIPAASRAAFTAPQIQALRVSSTRINLLTPQQVSWLTTAQIQSLGQYDFPYLAPGQIPKLTPAQIATVPDDGMFAKWTPAARAALTMPQVQALRVATVHLHLLTPTQTAWLTAGQIRSLGHHDFKYLNASQAPLLTATQVASVPDAGAFAMWNSAARAALTMPQVQALRVATVRLHLLTPTQRSWLTPAQIRSLDHFEFKYLNASQTPLLTAAQVASIPDIGSFGTWSAAARAALTQAQVQALKVRDVRLLLLTPAQRSWLTPAQIRSLQYYDFSMLNGNQTPLLTLAQVASIPNVGSFGAWSAAARGALTVAQVQALNVAAVRIELLTAQQRSWLTAAQVRSLPQHQFQYLLPSHTPLLTTAQIASIPDVGAFAMWSAAARGSLTPAQVQSLNVAKVFIELLTPAQVAWLTTPQVRSLPAHQFGYLHSHQIPTLTTGQIASIPNVGLIAEWSAAARAALTYAQVRSLSANALRLDLLTPLQIGWLTTSQIRSRGPAEFELLQPSQIPLLSVEQMASLPSTYNLALWSDEQQAALTRAQLLAIPYSVLNPYFLLSPEMAPPTDYLPVMPGQPHGPHGHGGEAAAVFNLVPLETATHRTVASGNWSDPRIWAGGVVPGAGARVVVSQGTTVRFDAYMNAPIFTLRIDGKLEFATNVNTQLKVDTIVVTTSGVLHIGTTENPIADHVTARVRIANNGPINATWDPHLWSRGLVSRGEVRMAGRYVTPYATLVGNLQRGDTVLYLNSAPSGWRVGDEIVIAGTNAHTPDFNSDRVRIRAIEGTKVVVDPLRYDHVVPLGWGVSLHVANLTRNVQFLAEGSPPAIQRPHIAFIHNPDVVVQNVGVYGFGRTDKTRPIDSPVVVNGIVQPGTGTNPRARYAIHFHHTGVNPSVAPAVVSGSVVDGSPGWGFVNHQSNVVMAHNVAVDVVGASFVGEDGNEIGLMFGNLSMNALGARTGESIMSRKAIHDFGHEGYGFWFQGPGIETINNISSGAFAGGFAYLPQSSKALFDAVNLDNPSMAAGRAAVPVGTVPLKRFDGNVSMTSGSGLEIWHHMMLMTDGGTTISNFTSWNTRDAGIKLQYVGHTLVRNVRLLGDLEKYEGVGVAANSMTHDITFNNVQVVGFETGIIVPVRRNTVISGGVISAVRGLYVEKGHDTIRTATVGGGILFLRPNLAQLSGRAYYDVYATARFDVEASHFFGRRVDSLLSDDVISISINGAAPGRLYFYEQAAGYIPFTPSTSAGYVPAGYLNKTNAQLAAQFGVSLGGEIPKGSAVQLPGIYGLMRYRF